MLRLLRSRTMTFAAIALLAIDLDLLSTGVRIVHGLPAIGDLYALVYPPAPGIHHQHESTVVFVLGFPLLATGISGCVLHALHASRHRTAKRAGQGLALATMIYAVFVIAALDRFSTIHARFGI